MNTHLAYSARYELDMRLCQSVGSDDRAKGAWRNRLEICRKARLGGFSNVKVVKLP